MTKKEFINKWHEILVTNDVKINKNDLNKSLDSFSVILETMVNQKITAENKNDLKISLPIGTFQVVQTKSRTASNPATGEKVAIPALQKIKFKAHKKLKIISS